MNKKKRSNKVNLIIITINLSIYPSTNLKKIIKVIESVSLTKLLNLTISFLTTVAKRIPSVSRCWRVKFASHEHI